MSKSPVWIVVVVALLAALAVVWSQLDDGAAPVPVAETPDQVSEPAPPPAADLSADASVAPDSKPAAPVREAVETETLQTPSDHTGPLLRVVAAGSGTPVPAAAVYFLSLDPERTAALAKQLRPGSRDPMRLLTENGLRLVTNAAGEVRLPASDNTSVVGAIKDDLAGFTEITANEAGTVVLELSITHEVAIVVRDSKGSPQAGVPVGFRSDNTRRLNVLWSSSTGADGVVVMTGPIPAGFRARQGAATSGILFLNFPHLDGPSVAIDLTDPPSDPVELTMPPTGIVEVIPLGAKAEEFDGVGVTLQSRSGATPELVPPSYETIADGKAEFTHVGLGMELTLFARRPASTENITDDISGPIAPGQRISVQLDMRSLTPVIVARLVDEQGDAIANQSLGLSLLAKSGNGTSSSSSSIETDSDGRVRIAVTDSMGRRAERTVTFSTSRNADRRLAHAVLPAALKPGENDIGTLTLGQPPLVCGGVVVNASGDPVVKARVTVSEEVIYGSGEEQRSYWRQLSGLETTTDAEGRFEVRGICNADRLGASARHDDYLPLSKQKFERSDTALRLVMQRAGMIEGSVAIPEGMAAHDLRVELHGGNEPLDDKRPNPSGSFRFASLSPGTTSVQVRLFGDFTPVRVIDNVEVRPGETTRDPRLQDIDISADIRVVEFRVTDTAGAPVRDATAVVLSPDEEQTKFEGHMLPDGVAAIPSRDGVIDVMVYADGYRQVTMRGLTTGQAIPLPRSLTARLRLPAGISTPPAPESLKVTLTPVGFEPLEDPQVTLIRGPSSTTSHSGSLPWQRSPAVACDASGAATVQVPAPGDYVAQWMLWRDEGGRQRGKPLTPPATITVRDAAAAQQFDAHITAEMLDAARKR